jgi:outer membrane protein assembly factor BamB
LINVWSGNLYKNPLIRAASVTVFVWVCRLSKRRRLFIVVGFVAIVLAAFLIVVFGRFLSPQGAHVLWQRDISQFATGFAAQDDRVFTLDISGGVVCYSATNGQTVWSGGRASYFCSGLTVSADIVYSGKKYSVEALDASTGEFLYGFGVPVDYSNRPPDSITVVDGRVVATSKFVMGESITVHNAADGQLLWEALPYPASPVFGNITNERDWWVGGYPLGGRFLDGNSVYASVEEATTFHILKLNTDNGKVLWRANVTNLGGSVLALYQGQVIVQNGKSVLSLNSASGATLWSADVGATIYQSTTANGLLLFGASDGNFYALNMDVGVMAWKTHFDSDNLLTLLENSSNLLTTFPIQVNAEDQRAFYAFAVTEQLGTTSENKHDQYMGLVSSLDLATGNRTWTARFEAADAFYNTPVGLAVDKNSVFVTSNSYLWTFAESTGEVFGVQHFDHYVLPPVMSDSRVFVVADLHVTAYT